MSVMVKFLFTFLVLAVCSTMYGALTIESSVNQKIAKILTALFFAGAVLSLIGTIWS